MGLLTGNKYLSPHALELISLEQSGCELLEYKVGTRSALINKQIMEISLPANALVTAIIRQNDIIAPRGETIIADQDILFILVRDEEKEELLNLLRAPPKESVAVPSKKPAGKPVAKAIAESSVTEPVVEPVTEPVAESVAEPVAESEPVVAEPAVAEAAEETGEAATEDVRKTKPESIPSLKKS